MRFDASDLAMIGDLTDIEFDLFRACVKQLLSKTFIMRGIDREEKLYDFAIRNIHLLELWFSCADAELKRDEGLGVIACRSGYELRAHLGRDETCALLVFRLLYEEKRGDLSLAKHPSVLGSEFTGRFRNVTGIEPRKTRIALVLRRLASFRLIGVPTDVTDPEGVIILYPSLALALDQNSVDEIFAALEKEKASGEPGEPGEITDDDEEEGE